LYKRNGVTFFSSNNIPPTFPLFADVSLAAPGATVKNVSLTATGGDGVPRDPISGFAVPVTQADWDAVFAAAGVTSKTVNQSWPLQDLSGNPIAVIGQPLIRSTVSPVQYREPVPGWERDSILFTPDGAGAFLFQQRTIAPDPSIESVLMFGYIAVDPAAGTRRVMVISGGSTGNILLSLTSGGNYRLVANAVGTVGTSVVTGPVRPVMLLLDRTNNVVRVYTDQEIITGTFPTLINNSTRGFGTSNNNGTSGVQRTLLAAQFRAGNAEWTEAEMRSVYNVLINGTVPW